MTDAASSAVRATPRRGYDYDGLGGGKLMMLAAALTAAFACASVASAGAEPDARAGPPSFVGGRRRDVRTVNSDCLPGSFDVDCFLRGGECTSPFLCNRSGGFYTTYRVIDEPNGNGTLRVLGPEDDWPRWPRGAG